MKRFAILVLVVVMAVSFALGEAQTKYDEASALIAEFIVNLRIEGVVALFKDIEQSEDGETYECTLFSGGSVSVNYADDVISSFSIYVDISGASGTSKMIDMMIAAIRTYSKLEDDEILAIMQYLTSELSPAGVMGKTSELTYEGYEFRFAITPIESIFFYIYPAD